MSESLPDSGPDSSEPQNSSIVEIKERQDKRVADGTCDETVDVSDIVPPDAMINI